MRKAILLFITLFITSCGTTTQTSTINENLSIGLPFLSTANTYLYNLTINEDSHQLQLPLKFNEEVNEEDISDISILDNGQEQNFKASIKTIDENKLLYLLNINNFPKEYEGNIKITLTNQKSYDIPLKNENVDIEESDATLAFNKFNVIGKDSFGYHYILDYTLELNEKAYEFQFSSLMENSPLSQASLSLYDPTSLEEINSFQGIINKGKYILRLTLNEDPYTYFFNETLILSYHNADFENKNIFFSSIPSLLIGDLFSSYTY